jgi:superfamily II DNA helicase RecQ
MLFGAADMMTQRRLADGAAGARHGDGLAELERYANAVTCRQQLLCTHFTGTGTGTGDHAVCGRCDACRDPDAVRGAPPMRRGRSRGLPGADGAHVNDGEDRHDGYDGHAAVALGAAEQQVILAAVAATARKVGRINLAKALHGSHAKTVVAQGLERLPQHGALAAHDEASIVAAIDQLVRERRLVRRGHKYPTIALPGPPRSQGTDRGGAGRTIRPRTSRTSSVTLELDAYRKRMARQLKWKAYMVFQRGVIAAIEQLRPMSREALARIPGLGPAKIARFGDDILAVVRRQSPQPIRD